MTSTQAFEECRNLWVFYRSLPHLHVRQNLVQGGHVQSLSVDYVCDFETSVKRTVGQHSYDYHLRLLWDNPELIPEEKQETLGAAFIDRRLMLDYGDLFIKQTRARERKDREYAVTQEAEEALASIEINKFGLYEPEPTFNPNN